MATQQAGCFQRFISILSRRKLVDHDSSSTKLHRCLSVFDLTALGIGSTMGAGIYVVAGQVARQTAGPSVVISFLIAAIASVFAGLCYAEFGARVPKTGSAYVYSYVTVGEIWAFIIGWNLILEYVIGTASVARAWSSYIDSMADHKISHYLNATIPMHVPSLAEYPDFFAFSITILLAVVLSIGVKESSMLNNIFTTLNFLIVAYVIVCGLFKINFDNWHIPADEVPPSTNSRFKNGKGGFFPFGVDGMLSGAATCFYAFVGFDCIATTGEEVKNPQKSIPIAIIVCLAVCFFSYFGISAILTLMVPYYAIANDAPLPKIFDSVGWNVASNVISVGAICGLSTSLLGAMFPMPRIIYAMAEDGLIFRGLAKISPKFRTPFIATILAGVLSGTMALLFNLKELVDMMSIGTLMAYTLVASSVLILRYKEVPFNYTSVENEDGGIALPAARTSSPINDTESAQLIASGELSVIICWRSIFKSQYEQACPASEKLVTMAVSVMGLLMVLCSVLLAYGIKYIEQWQLWAWLLLVVFIIPILLCCVLIWRQPQNTNFVTFKVPFVSLISPLSMFINIYLMMKLSAATWARFGVWMTIGFIIYFSYGIFHSAERQEKSLQTTTQVTSESEDQS